MTGFTSFVILASMRTGSNFLESNLNKVDGLQCFGEAFNPVFVGTPQTGVLFGLSLQDRETDPHALFDQIRACEGLGGFRFFHDHDPRILQSCLDDRRCAKIVLTRNPVDSFVSWKIAQATGQWKMTNITRAKSARVIFDRGDFFDYLDDITAFHHHIMRQLQITGQTAFHIRYDDLHQTDILNGLLRFLGQSTQLKAPHQKLKRQNPAPLCEKVVNYQDVAAIARDIGAQQLAHHPPAEPRRNAAIRTYIAAPVSGLLYLPIPSGPVDEISRWLAAVDDRPLSSLITGFTHRSLQDWQNSHHRRRSFTVLRHPLLRAHAAFCDRILSDGPQALPQMRDTLRRVHHIPIPEKGGDMIGKGKVDHRAYHAAFLRFLQFLKANLAGQTSLRVDVSWASQITCLQGFATSTLPDLILREDDLQQDLPQLAGKVGVNDPPVMPSSDDPRHAILLAIYDPALEKAARAAYARDYSAFGFANFA